MKCSEARSWLLAVKATPALPAEVQQHLRICRHCRLRHKELLRLHQELVQLPLPPQVTGARARLLAAIERVPQVCPGSRPDAKPLAFPRVRRLRWPILAVAGGAVAAAMLVGLALSGWPMGDPDGLASRRPALPSVPGATEPMPPVAKPSIVARTVEHDLSLAGTSAPMRRLQTLEAMAADLDAIAEPDEAAWMETRKPFLLY